MDSITYTYEPPDWNQERFDALGGFTAVFLNYNKGAAVSSSVPSVLNQDFPLLEIFLMDDASTDGSGEVMEKIAREYKGRHKVIVVRNRVNQTICGQWNVASKLATGRWFGMFCGDDVAMPDRVSAVAERLKQYPHALGICTRMKTRDGIFGIEDPFVWRGDGGKLPANMFGASTFWNRELFDSELPRCNLDDYLLQCMAVIRSWGSPYPILVWATDLITVNYALTGMTNLLSTNMVKGIGLGPALKRWKIEDVNGRKFGIHVWRHVIAYDKCRGRDQNLSRIMDGLSVLECARSAGWFGRFKVFLSVHVWPRKRNWGYVTPRVIRTVNRRFFAYLGGTNPILGYTWFAVYYYATLIYRSAKGLFK